MLILYLLVASLIIPCSTNVVTDIAESILDPIELSKCSAVHSVAECAHYIAVTGSYNASADKIDIASVADKIVAEQENTTRQTLAALPASTDNGNPSPTNVFQNGVAHTSAAISPQGFPQASADEDTEILSCQRISNRAKGMNGRDRHHGDNILQPTQQNMSPSIPMQTPTTTPGVAGRQMPAASGGPPMPATSAGPNAPSPGIPSAQASIVSPMQGTAAMQPVV